MDFFQQQEIARKNSRWLVLLFALAVLGLIVLTNLFLLLFPWQLDSAAFSEQGSNAGLVCLVTAGCDFWRRLDWQQMAWVSVFVSLVILTVSLFKWLQIRQGGKVIARMMGARLVRPDSGDFAEKRLFNIVEEMALAANMPAPAVYLMDDEDGINAFAAGFGQGDAVVVVTRGSLQAFNRDQLQGVIAHEFSHILNGDMALNMKLIAVLHGIMFITESGFALLRNSRFASRHSRRNNAGPLLFLALGLIVIGALGTLFASLIKAAVSRQREYLADASAVQFTRNPSGIADALKIIGGGSSQVSHRQVGEISHFFFASAVPLVHSLFATHPPLQGRIRRIQPRWNGRFIQVPQPSSAGQDANSESLQHRQQMAAVMTAATMIEAGHASQPGSETLRLVDKEESLHQPMAAAAAVVCLLYDQADLAQRRLIDALADDWPCLYQAIQASIWQGQVRQDFLPVMELAVSALRLLQPSEYERLKRLLMQLVQADGRVDLYEWALFHVLRCSLDSHFLRAQRHAPAYRHISSIADDVKTVVAMLVRQCIQDEQKRRQAYFRACNSAGVYLSGEAQLPDVTQAGFSQSVNRIARAFPLLKPRVLKALVSAVTIDGDVSPLERQTLVAISMAIDAPLPGSLMAELGL